MKEVISKAMVKWHMGQCVYYEQLPKCCLDSNLKEKYQRKIIYHTTKLRDIM
jgi:hypothetical protein